jgi:hypothetical protein
MSRIAYIISAYKDPAHLARLIRALEGDADFYVHVDANVDDRPFREAVGDKACFVARHYVSWGGWEQVEYQRELLQAVIASGRDYGRVVCLSGQDYPLVSNRALHAAFDAEPDREFICGYSLTRTTDARQLRKIRRYHPLRDLRLSNRWLKNKFVVGSRLLMAMLPLRRKPWLTVEGHREEVYFGSDYWAITLPCARYVVDRLTREPAYARYFRTTFVPSELCIQTIIFNSPFAVHAIRMEGVYPGLTRLTPLHLIVYGAQIKEFTADDYAALRASGKMFCRKVVSGKGDALVALIDADRAADEAAAITPSQTTAK